MYFCQRNKWYPQRCLLAHFEATLDFSSNEFICPYIYIYIYLYNNNINQICYCGQISLLNASVNCSYSNYLRPLGVIFILLTMVHIA